MAEKKVSNLVKGTKDGIKKHMKKGLKDGLKKQKDQVPFTDPWNIVMYPLLTEKAIGMVERENKLIFVVKRTANKKQIRWSIEKLLEVKLDNVRTMIDRKGRKKAIVKLTKDFSAADIATRFGML